MSTACEALAARHMGLEVCGISCITNLAAGLSDKKAQPQGSAGKPQTAWQKQFIEQCEAGVQK